MAQRVVRRVHGLPGLPREVTELRRAWAEFGIDRKAWGYVADQAPVHPSGGRQRLRRRAAALADFDGISYAKGASVLRQLADHLGDEVFFGGLRDATSTGTASATPSSPT